jgi:predicted alpha-1,6-mannanase (GH76 family)
MTLTVRIRGERQVVSGSSPHDLVGQMNRASFDARSDQREWMKLAAERAHSLTGCTIRSDTSKHFLEDLLSSGMIEETETDHD